MTAAGAATRLKVAIVYPFFAHYREPVLRELLDHGAHDYYLLADSIDRFSGIPVIDFSNQPRFIPTPTRRVLGFMWQSGLLGAALKGRYDCYIFLGNAAWPATWLAALLARVTGRRVFFWTHGWIRRDRPPLRWLRAIFYRIGHGLLLYGHHARTIALEQGFTPESVHVIYNSLNFDRQQQLRERITPAQVAAKQAELFADPRRPIVIATARLTLEKRFDLLIEAARILSTRNIAVNVLIVGNGPQRTLLEQQAQAGDVTVNFVGSCYEEESLALLFSCAAVTVSPGNVGLTCMHSLGYGVPVLTHDDPCEQMPEWEAITAGLTGGFFSKGDASSLADALVPWLCPSRDSVTQREHCVRTVRDAYHPAVQRRLIDAAVAGVSATANTVNVSGVRSWQAPIDLR